MKHGKGFRTLKEYSVISPLLYVINRSGSRNQRMNEVSDLIHIIKTCR